MPAALLCTRSEKSISPWDGMRYRLAFLDIAGDFVTIDNISTIRALSLHCLLEDQLVERDSTADAGGSWGRSTLDYCYMSPWTSVPQTISTN